MKKSDFPSGSMKENEKNDIAIVGMSALFPKAADLNNFWANILNKVDGVEEADPGWVDDIFLDPESRAINRIYTKAGGFLKDLARFHPASFGVLPVSLYGGEPDQFLALKLAMDALADAGYSEREFDAENTGIILGHSVHAHLANTSGIQHGIVLDQTLALLKSLIPDISSEALGKIEETLKAKLPPATVDVVPGLVPNMMTGRIANRLNLMGPNFILDGACASANLALEMAMLELQCDRAKMMLAGGINTSTSPLVYMIFCQLQAVSHSSRIRPFDAKADGTLLGEGAGILVLKKVSQALEDGDRIYAVIKGIGQSSDGRGRGLMAPRLEGETLAIRRAYETSGIPPDTIGLVEAHGTGIPLGDQTEIQALIDVLGRRKGRFPRCALGSVKSMIGHCIPAAGSAGIIKSAMALYHKILPPTLCEEVNPDLKMEETPFYINTEVRPWIHGNDHPRRAGINAFGFGGINSHVILEEPPEKSRTKVFDLARPAPAREAQSELLLFAHDTREELVVAVKEMEQRLSSEESLTLPHLASELWRQCGTGPLRLALIVRDRNDLSKKVAQLLKKLEDGDVHGFKAQSGVYFSDRPMAGKVAFLFPGEGSQYPNMLKGLAERFPVVLHWFDFLDRLFGKERDVLPSQAIMPLPTSITPEHRKELNEVLHKMDLGSESVFVADQAMFALLTRFGLRPDAMLGHSTGENSALVASGIALMSEADVAAYIYEMNRLYQELNDSGRISEGVLLSVGGVDRGRIDELISNDPRLVLTMDNCRHQVILFGPEPAVSNAVTALKGDGGICLELPFGRAYHTESMLPMARSFRELFKDIPLQPNDITIYSCATKAPLPRDEEELRHTIALQYVNRVHFRETIERMHSDGIRFFVEVGPSGHLTSFVKDILRKKDHVAAASNLRKRDDLTQILHLLATLFIHRMPVDLTPLYPEPGGDRSIDKARSMPYLPSNLPFIRLSEKEAEKLRGMLPERAAVTPAARPYASRPGSEKAKVIKKHFDLMKQFLEQQGRVMTTGNFTGAGRRLAADIARGNDSLPSPLSLDGRKLFQLPFSSAVRFIPTQVGRVLKERLKREGDQALLSQLLSRDEISAWPPSRNRKRTVEWLLGRLAAKEAIRQWAAEEQAITLDLREIEIAKDERGKPVVNGSWPDRQKAPPTISLSHLDGTAVAIAGPTGYSVGVDLDRSNRIQISREEFEEMVNSPAERQYLRGAEEWEKEAMHFWTAKEAAAKALGFGFTVNPKDLEVTKLEDSNDRGHVRYKNQLLKVQWSWIGEYICAVAYG